MNANKRINIHAAVDMDQDLTKPTRADQARRNVLIATVMVLLGMLLTDPWIIVLLSWAERVPAPRYRQSYWENVVLFIAPFLAGILIAQLILPIAYSALGDGSSPKRVLYTAFTVVIFTNVLAVFATWWLQARWTEVVYFSLLPVLLFFLFQIPVWGIRSLFGWKILSPWSQPGNRQPMRFSLAHILGWSVFLAVPLGILQALLVPNPRGSIVYVVFLLCFWSVVLCLQLMWSLYAALAADWRIGKSIALSTLVLLIAVFTQIAGMSLWFGLPDLDTVLVITGINFSASAVALGCLRFAHRLGFRLLPFEASRTE